MLYNPVKQTETNRNGIEYVVNRMGWYCILWTHLLKESVADGSELSATRRELKTQIVNLYKELLLYQMKSVYSYYCHRGLVFLRDIIRLDDWEGGLISI